MLFFSWIFESAKVGKQVPVEDFLASNPEAHKPQESMAQSNNTKDKTMLAKGNCNESTMGTSAKINKKCSVSSNESSVSGNDASVSKETTKVAQECTDKLQTSVKMLSSDMNNIDDNDVTIGDPHDLNRSDKENDATQQQNQLKNIEEPVKKTPLNNRVKVRIPHFLRTTNITVDPTIKCFFFCVSSI